MTLNVRIIVFQCILYQYIESFVFLEVSRRGSYTPLAPPKFATGNYVHIEKILVT